MKRSAASQREEIQKKLELLRQEREREQKAFDEIAASNTNLTPSEIADIARKKASEDKPQCLQVDNATITVGDYVSTLDDVHVLLAAENGILIPDPVKKVYLGEKGQVQRVFPSFQGKPALEMRFADGAVKIFLVECVAIGNNTKKQRRTSSVAVGSKTETSNDPSSIHRVPEYVPPQVPEPLPQPTWNSIDMPSRRVNGKDHEKKQVENEQKAKGKPVETKCVHPVELRPLTAISAEGIGLVREVLLDEERCRKSVASNEQLGSPLSDGVGHQSPLLSRVEQDNLLKTPRPDLLTYSFPRRSAHPVRNGDNEIPMACPENYEGRFSLNDVATGVPRLENAVHDRKNFRVAGVLPGRVGLKFQLVTIDNNSSMESVLVTLTHALHWHLTGNKAMRVFTLKGEEIANVDAIEEGSSLVATTGQDFFLNVQAKSDFPQNPNRAIGNSVLVKKSVHSSDPTRPPSGSATPKVAASRTDTTRDLKYSADQSRLSTRSGAAPLRTSTHSNDPRRPPSDSTAPKVAASRTDTTRDLKCSADQSRLSVSGGTAPSRTSTLCTVHSKDPHFSASGETVKVHSDPIKTPSTNCTIVAGVVRTRAVKRVIPGTPAPLPSSAVPRKSVSNGITKPISMRVYCNGEYGDRHTDRFPFRTVTLRPAHKTLTSVFNTLGRDLEWHASGRKVEVLYDATGAEITSLDELYDGQAIVASSGDRFVIPHPHTVLHEEAMKVAATIQHATVPPRRGP